MQAELQSQERKDRIIAGILSATLSGLLLLFLILFTIVTPNPPFELPADGGMEVNFGTYNEGTGQIENDGIGDVTSVVTNTQPANPNVQEKADEKEVFENGETIEETKPEKPKVQNNTTIITPVKPVTTNTTATSPANPLLNAYKNNKGKTGGGDGNSGNSGNEGDPDGNPNTNGLGGSGNNPNHIGTGNGPGGPGINLTGRKILNPPCKVNDSKEEGLVVVVITVDKMGNVIDADPNGKGTTTFSSVLKSKARQAALCAKFSPSNEYETQKGSIIFKFEF